MVSRCVQRPQRGRGAREAQTRAWLCSGSRGGWGKLEETRGDLGREKMGQRTPETSKEREAGEEILKLKGTCTVYSGPTGPEWP